MLDEVGLYASGSLSSLLRDPPPRRSVAVQFGETDLAFLTRLLAEDGLAYTLLHDQASETLLIFDESAPRSRRSPCPWGMARRRQWSPKVSRPRQSRHSPALRRRAR